MSFLQTYYTSCEVGLRGGKGFQFNAATEGIDPATLQQVERLGLYVPPVSLPSRPSDAEIERFPLALLYQRLAGGGAVIAQARYKGMDYSGRYGNYFTHALVSKDSRADLVAHGLLPIELWMSEDWESEPVAATELPPLDSARRGDQINDDEVMEFLTRSGRIERLPQFLTAVARALNGERRIVIVDEDQNVALWIAAACYALPAALALRLTFNTYVKNPYQTDFLIVGTTSDSDFRFAPHEIDYQFFVFDFPGDRFSKIPDISCYAAMAAALYGEGSPERLADFGLFADRIVPDLEPAELDAAMACYAATIGLAPAQMNRAEVIRWLAKRWDAFQPEELRAVLDAALAGRGLGKNAIEACTDLYLAARDQHVHRLIEEPYFKALIVDAGASADVELLDSILRRLPSLHEPARQSARPYRQAWLGHVLHAKNPNHLNVMFQLGDRFGFLDEEDEAFAAIGRNVIEPLLQDSAVREMLFGLVDKPAFRPIIWGIASYLAEAPQAFRSRQEIVSHPAVRQAIEQYAISHNNSALLVRLRASDPSSQPDRKLQSFIQSIDQMKRFDNRSLSPQQVDDAIDVVWQGKMPADDECPEVARLLLAEGLWNSSVLQRITGQAISTDIKKLTPKQKELIFALTDDKAFFNKLDQRTQVFLEGYLISIFAEERLMKKEATASDVQYALDFLRKNGRSLNRAIEVRGYELLAACVALVESADDQYALLGQGNEGRLEFIACYGEAVINVLGHPSGKHHEIMAKWFRYRVFAELHRRENAQPQPAPRKYAEPFKTALQRWPPKDLDEIGKHLGSDTHHQWVEWRKKNFGGLRSIISKFRR
jgi:hypothetical protein